MDINITEETQTETAILETEIATEKNKAPLEDISQQNAQILDLSYNPQSDSCLALDTIVPQSMRYDLHKALETVNRRVNGVDEYVADKLGYIVGNCSLDQRKDGLKCLCDAFGAEQVDAIAVAIYNIEEKKQGCIIGDQTGLGKGRIAAGMLRYAINKGLKPIFITEKPNLFSDIYRDLIAIGSDDAIPLQILDGYKEVQKKLVVESEEADSEEEAEELFDEVEIKKVPVYVKNPNYDKEIKGKKRVVPFIVNGSGSNTSVKDESGNILYKGLSAPENKGIIGSLKVPKEYNLILATYSQFNKLGTEKTKFLATVAAGSIVVLDESHNASGDSNTGRFLQEVLGEAEGCIFLSATFAKRPDNMPIYASKTALSDANLTSEELISAISSGGVALQEIVSANLVNEGQMIRRERSFEGIEVNYEYLDATQRQRGYPDMDLEEKHRAIMDNATSIIRQIMDFQHDFCDPLIVQMDKIAAAEYTQVDSRKGTRKAGVDNYPIFSGVFNMINQLLFSIKAEAVAETAIQRLKQGKKPIIAFASTMESFLDTLTNDDGQKIMAGDTINADFSMVLKKRLNGVLRYTVTDAKGNKEYESIDPYEQDEEFQGEYTRILNLITRSSIGICSSPIDILIDRIEKAGFSVTEVTGRNKQLKILGKNKAQVKNKTKVAANDAFRQFNNNETDCLLINQSGSTGASAHALPTARVPKEQVRQRVMIILQAELNINTEVQKRGRINRTGQILKPIYDYIISAIPAEKRLMMMLQKKLKSLDANTTSNQKQSAVFMDAAQMDFLNKIGDQIVYEYCLENPLFVDKIGDPLKMGKNAKENDDVNITDAASKVSGRVAILSCKEQDSFYQEISQRYMSTVEYLIQSGQYDLEVEDIDLQAETISKDVVIVGKGGDSVFGRHSILEKVSVKNTRKPYSKVELDAILKQSLGEFQNPYAQRDSVIKKFKTFMANNLAIEQQDITEHYDNLISEIANEKQAAKAANLHTYIKERTEDLEDARDEALNQAGRVYLNKIENIEKTLNYFYVGKVVGYPSITYSIDNEFYKAVFLGFQINESQKNPYSPSAIKARFAIAGSQRYISVPLSKYDIISLVKSITTTDIYSSEAADILENWDAVIAEKNADRTTRYIVTGNILQAFGKAELKGSLVSYTTIGGGIKKGILLPDGFSPNARGKDKPALRITVPIRYVVKILKSMSMGTTLRTKDELTFQRTSVGYYIYVPTNKKTGGKFYLNPTILKLVYEGRFDKTGDQMRALLEERKLENLVDFLQENFNSSVELTANQYDLIKDQIIQKDYTDEERIPEPDVFLTKLTEEDRLEEQKRAEEEKQRLLEQEDQERQARLAEEEAQKTQADNLLMEQRKMDIKKKMINVIRLFNRQSLLVKGGKIGQSERDKEMEELKVEAYKIGQQACKDNEPRVPSQNNKLAHLIVTKWKGYPADFKGTTAIYTAFENGYYNENEKELRRKFPKMYTNR